jgi:hypothetical protein
VEGGRNKYLCVPSRVNPEASYQQARNSQQTQPISLWFFSIMELQQCNGTRSENFPASMAQSLYAGHLFDEELQARWFPVACSQQPEYSQPPHGGHAAGAELSNRAEYNQCEAGFSVASGTFEEYGSSQVVHDPLASPPAEVRFQLSVELDSNKLGTAATQPGY